MKTYRQYQNYSSGAKIIAWSIDLIGNALFWIGKASARTWRSIVPGRKKNIPSPVKKILLIRLDHFGDLLMTTPAFHALKQRFPGCSLSLLASPSAQAVIAGNPEIDALFTFRVPWYDGKRAQGFSFREYWRLLRRLRQEHFDVAMDFRGDFRVLLLFSFLSGARQRVGFANIGGEFLLTRSCPYSQTRHFVEMNLALANCLDGPPAATATRYHLHISAPDVSHIDRVLAGLGLSDQDKIVGIHPTTIAHWQLKRWPAERFAALADALIRRAGVKIMFTGAEEDAPDLQRIASAMQGQALVLAGKTSLMQLAELIRRFRLFVSNDTGPMHIAVAVQTPLVAIFGPTDPMRSGPFGNPERFRIARHEVPCRRPCFVSACPRDHECMSAIAIESVLADCLALLDLRAVPGTRAIGPVRKTTAR